MPELPEVESLRRSLQPLIGLTVLRAELLRADVGVSLESNAPATSFGLSPGTTIVRLERHGKQLAIVCSNDQTLVVHLGMSGQLLLGPCLTTYSHTHAQWTFTNHTVLRFRDPRRFGGLWSAAHIFVIRERLWNCLGPDALQVTGKLLHRVMQHTRRPIKSVLLDQTCIAGIGNIYADESLFLAQLRPTLRGTLSVKAADRLANAIREVLQAAIDRGGSSLRDYLAADGSRGNAQKHHFVYGRVNLPCLVCQTKLKPVSIAQRTTVYCRVCQPATSE